MHRNLPQAVPASRLGPPIQLIRHRPGAPGLRLGLGPHLRPHQALVQLQGLLADNGPWASGRSIPELHRMLRGSEAVVSAWRGLQLVGFGRATSDGQFRAVLWDVVVAQKQQGQGLGRLIVEALLTSPLVAGVERIYLMTTKGEGFYERIGFSRVESQKLMLLQQPEHRSSAGSRKGIPSSDAVERHRRRSSPEARQTATEV